MEKYAHIFSSKRPKPDYWRTVTCKGKHSTPHAVFLKFGQLHLFRPAECIFVFTTCVQYFCYRIAVFVFWPV